MNIDHPHAGNIPGMKALWGEAFGDTDAQIELFFATSFCPERSLCITENGTVAAALYWMDCAYSHGKLAYIYAVATSKVHRGKGLCRMLTEKTHEVLKSQGYAGAVLVPANEELFALYGKFGYEELSCMDTLRCAAGGSTLLQKRTPEEFSAARQKYLPQGGVKQEDFAYLSGYASLYEGENFTLVCTETEGGKVLGMELLGDKTQASKIVAALGCTEGEFRIPGSGRFAMFCAFARVPAPSYFGIAFD